MTACWCEILLLSEVGLPASVPRYRKLHCVVWAHVRARPGPERATDECHSFWSMKNDEVTLMGRATKESRGEIWNWR